MQIFSTWDNLHEMLNHVFRKNKKNITDLLSAELAKRLVKVKEPLDTTEYIERQW